MRRSWLALAVALVVGIVWLLRWDGGVRRGAELRPARLALRAGEHAEMSLVCHERRVAAVGFRLRFDAAVVSIDGAEPAYGSVVDGGPALVMPPRSGPGLLEVPGVALTGGRVFKGSDAVYRFIVHARAPGTSAIRVEGFTVVDADTFQERTADVQPSEATVRP